MKNNRNYLLPAFLLTEGILYILILTTGGKVLVASSYAAIVLCFVYALLHKGVPLMVGGLAATVAADFFLVVCTPQNKLLGMICFLIVQTCYAIILHRRDIRMGWLMARLALTASIVAITVAVLQEKTDALALVSVCYYANLVWNMVMAFCKFRKNGLLAIGFVLFILCDTVIGLQVAAQGYLPIEAGTLLHRILFVDFNLSWFFYLPSQVLIALTAVKSN